MTFDPATTRQMIEAIAHDVIAHAEELTELDRAIGDADHGVNLDRGFRAVLAKIDAIAAQPMPQALSEVGKTLILSVGGASGPLYGKLFATIGRELADCDAITRDRIVAACERAIDTVKALGKSDVGHKTMLDVLVPALEALRTGDGAASLDRVRERTHAAAQGTIPMLALRGRASFLGERSRGHMDPGARSSELIVTQVCRFLEARGLFTP
jgi:dihydroxyacetone kinase-like protein